MQLSEYSKRKISRKNQGCWKRVATKKRIESEKRLAQWTERIDEITVNGRQVKVYKLKPNLAQGCEFVESWQWQRMN